MGLMISHFDHFVVPVDNLVAAEDFYTDVFGAVVDRGADGLPKRMGLTMAQRNYGMVPHTFLVIADKRIGIYLQSEGRPKPEGVHGAPNYSFATTTEGLQRAIRVLEQRKAPHEVMDDEDSPHRERSVFFNDPAGNHYHIYVRTAGGDESVAPAHGGAMSAVGHLRIEAPEIERSERFYRETFGLSPAKYRGNKRLNAREALFHLPSGQFLSLCEVPFSPKGLKLSRAIPGPHFAFWVLPDQWEPLCNRLATLGISTGDRGMKAKNRASTERDTYIDDPAGNVVQLISQALAA